MPSSAKKPTSKRRTASKEERRLQLIRATIRSIAKRGLSDTTMAAVCGEAQLSQGIINLHFQSKERLLVETLRYVADEYRATWVKALSQAGDSSSERMEALVDVDFARPVCERNKLAVWFAFWGESKSRPTYRKICAERDREYDEILTKLCANLITEGPYPGLDAGLVATGLASMSEGLWLDLLVNPEHMNPEKAKRVYLTYLTGLFPNHFSNPSPVPGD
jgi:TetR/AcrR family transcriptional repressor of bet genes